MYTFTEVSNDEWVKLTGPTALYPHTLFFGDLQESMGRTVLRRVIEHEGSTVGYFQAVVYPLFKNKTLVYLPYGPVFFSSINESKLSDALKTFGESLTAVLVRIDPEATPTLLQQTPRFFYRSVYHQPRGEWVQDITKSESELLAAMHKKTRYNISKSEKQDLTTRFFNGEHVTAFTEFFIELNSKNTESHQTTTHPDSYFENLFTLLSKDQNHFIAITRKDETVIAMNIFVRIGDEFFCPFGASSEEGKKLGAYYHIKWSAIQHMKSLGGTRFNWGGISVGIEDSYLSGVTQFKQGFGGKVRNHGYLYDIVISKFWYFLYTIKKLTRG